MQNILDKLEKVRKVRGGFKARCPVDSHNDKTQSLFLRYMESEEGEKSIQIKCFAGDSTKEIMNAIGMKVSDLFKDNEENIEMAAVEMKKERIENKGKCYESIDEIKKGFDKLEDAYEYNYSGEDASILQIRYLNSEGNKQFATFHKEDDGWYAGKPEGLMPLYNLNEVEKVRSILIVEGEKKAKICAELGIPYTCSLGGANNARNTDWTPLMGKSVAMFRDYNKAGKNYENDIKEILSNLNVNLKCIEVEKSGIKEGDDLEQFVELHKGKSAEQIRKLIYGLIPKVSEQPVSITDSHLKPYLDKVYKGQADNIEMIGFPILSDITQMMIPGSISLIYSQPGVGKSLLTQQIANTWTESNQVRVKSLLLESSINTYLLRCLSRVARRFDVLKNRFHKENPTESARIVNEYSEVLDLCASTMVTSDLQKGRRVVDWTPESVIEFIKNNAPTHDVIIVDPISRVLGMGRSQIWEDTNKITAQVEAILSENSHCRVVFVHHPTDQEGGTVSGGMGWSRFVHNTLYIVKEPEEILYEIITNDGDIIATPLDRYIVIKKCRAGEGLDTKIGIRMAKDCLSFEEVGRIVRKVK